MTRYVILISYSDSDNVITRFMKDTKVMKREARNMFKKMMFDEVRRFVSMPEVIDLHDEELQQAEYEIIAAGMIQYSEFHIKGELRAYNELRFYPVLKELKTYDTDIQLIQGLDFDENTYETMLLRY